MTIKYLGKKTMIFLLLIERNVKKLDLDSKKLPQIIKSENPL